MQRFHVIDEGAVILRSNGKTYRQVKVARRGRDVFAMVGGGFIRLLGRSGTTDPKTSWLDLEAEGVEVDARGVPKFVADDLAEAVAA